MSQSPYSSSTQVAGSVPFDNSVNGFVATDVQAAIEEVNAKITVATTIDQTAYVNKGGNDTTGNGSIGQPYLTVAKAISSITDASPTKRYGIIIGPGDYNENLVIKANMFFIGQGGPLGTRITGTTININDATWNVAGSPDNRSGFQDITINNTATWDFTAQTNNTAGKLYFWNIRTGNAWTTTALNAVNQLIIQDSELFGTTTFNGMATFVSSSTWQSGNLVVNSSSAAGIPASFTADGSLILGNITATWTSNSAVTLNLSNLSISGTTVMTASGASCTVNASADSIPVPANRAFSSGATLVRLNDNYAAGLLSATTNVTSSAATAPTAGQALVASSSTVASWTTVYSLNDSEASATASATAGTGADALMTGMTLTPAAGGYLVWFSCDLNSATAGVVVSVSIYVGGVQKADSLRKIEPFAGGTLTSGSQRVGCAINGKVTVNGSQAIEIRWSASAGAPTVAGRTLNLLQVD